MSTFEVGLNQALFHFSQYDKNLEALRDRMSTGKKINDSRDDPIGWAKARRDRFESQARRTANDALSEVTRNVKVADLTMNTIGKYIGIMKSDLERIVTNFSSYVPGDPQRATILQSYRGLLRQIDDLAVPLSDTGAKAIMADPATVIGAGNWNVPVNANSDYVTIRSREVHTGATGLNIPVLADGATDAEIRAAIESLDTAAATLNIRRAGLAGDASGITQAQNVNAAIARAVIATAEDLENADMEEVAALEKVEEVRYQLALESLKGLIEMNSQLVNILG